MQFPLKQAGQDLSSYGGRPDGASVDVRGNYWVAMFEGSRVCQFAPDVSLLAEFAVPLQCTTMPCFGGEQGDDLALQRVVQGRVAHGT